MKYKLMGSAWREKSVDEIAERERTMRLRIYLESRKWIKKKVPTCLA